MMTNPSGSDTKLGGSRRRRLRRDERKAEHLAGYRITLLVGAWNRWLQDERAVVGPRLAADGALALLELLHRVVDGGPTNEGGERVRVPRGGVFACFILACFLEPDGELPAVAFYAADTKWIWRFVEIFPPARST